VKRPNWIGSLIAIGGVALAAAVGAAALPDNPYQRWQLIENTLYANATWSYERMHFDPAPIDVAIIGSSRAQLGLSAPAVTARLAALGHPLRVANLAVVEDGRNIEWAIADELFRTKHPRVIVLAVEETVHLWGHPGFKYVAPAAAIAAPRALALHNAKEDVPYLPYRQLMLAGAAFAPGWFGLHPRFDPVRFAAKRAEREAFAATRSPSHIPEWIGRVTDADDHVYVDAIARLAAAHGTRIIFLFLPEFEGVTTIADRAFYAARGTIIDAGDLAADPRLFQSFAHLNHRGAVIASDRVAVAVATTLAPRSAPVTPVTN